jgi:hypothetical protein|tara:strand:+ start:583 stop:774 length:192 start_codon:yes stop_codon:yes gene_type:complete
MITITRRSPLTGKTNTMRLDLSEGALHAWKGGMLAQDAMPNLSADEREFVMTGITPYEWEEYI